MLPYKLKYFIKYDLKEKIIKIYTSLFYKNIEKLLEKRNVNALAKSATYLSNHDLREKAVEALGKIGDRRAVGKLVLIGNWNYSLRSNSIQALGDTGNEEAIIPLALHFLTSFNHEVVTESCKALDNILSKLSVKNGLVAISAALREIEHKINEYAGSYVGHLDRYRTQLFDNNFHALESKIISKQDLEKIHKLNYAKDLLISRKERLENNQ